MKYEIRKLPESDMVRHTDVAFHSYPSFKDFSADGKKAFTSRMLGIRKNDPNVEFYGMYDEQKLIAQMRLITFEMNVFGKVVPVAGLGSLAVDLCYKKQGIGHQMLTYFEEFFRKKGISLAMLLPFSPSFYHDAEYGYGTKMNYYRVATKDLPKYSDKANYRFLTGADRPAVEQLFKNCLQTTHGLMARLSYEWEDIFTTPGNILVGSFTEEDQLDGFLCFRLENDKADNYTIMRIEVKDLWSENPQAFQKLLNFLNMQADQAQHVYLRTFQEDFHFVLRNAINITDNFLEFGYLETNQQYVGNMYKVLDMENFFDMTAHRDYNGQTMKVCFDVSDQTQNTQEKIILEIENAKGKIVNSAEKIDLTIRLSLADFSSLMMGVTTSSRLYQLGQLHTDFSEKLHQLDLALMTDYPPVCWGDY